MGATVLLMMLAAQENQRRQEEARRRREEEDKKRKKKAEENRKREEEYRRLVEYRKKAPLVYDKKEQWQMDRCVKAISLHPFVRKFVSLIDGAREKIIKAEEAKYDERLLEVNHEYETVKRELDSNIETLRKLGISIEGRDYELMRVKSNNICIANIEVLWEFFGNTFVINKGYPIVLSPEILSNNRYYEMQYKEMEPDRVEQEYIEISRRVKKYQKYGRVLKFLLKTSKYLDLEEQKEDLESDYKRCELRKKEMQSFESLGKEELTAIRDYFKHLDELMKISYRIKGLFHEKEALRYEDNIKVYDLAIKEVMSSSEYSDIVYETYDFIHKILLNDEGALSLGYSFVNGEYPVHISRKTIYDLLISNIKGITEEDVKRLILGEKK